MKRIDLRNYQKQIDELKGIQAEREIVSLIIATPEPDGKIRASIHRGSPSRGTQSIEYFQSENELLGISGICESTVYIWDEVYD